MTKVFAFLAAALFMSSYSVAQTNEIGFLLGRHVVSSAGAITPDHLETKGGVAYGLTYSHSWTRHLPISVGYEIPFVATPSQFVRSNDVSVPRNYASIFVTPALRVKLLPNSAISPWGSVGGGYARFDESTTLVTGQKNTFKTGKNSGAFEVGGGVDFKLPILPIALRGEVRDFYAGEPQLNLPRTNDKQHNVIVSGGFVLHF